MPLIPLLAMVRTDLQLFFSDRRAVIMSFAAPIAIASFFGSIFSGPDSGEPARIPVAIVDQDAGPVSKAILASAQNDRNLRITTPDADGAREGVRKGSVAVAVIIPAGFGEAAGRAFFSGSDRPTVALLYDPSRGAELGLVRGMLTQHVMESVSREMFTGAGGRKVVDDMLQNMDQLQLPAAQEAVLRELLQSARRLNDGSVSGGGARGISVPYDVSEQAITSGENVRTTVTRTRSPAWAFSSCCSR